MGIRVYPEKREFLQLAKTYNLIPVYAEVICDIDTPISLYYKLARGGYSFLLESVEGAEKWARYSFIGTNPFLIFKSKGKEVYTRFKNSNSFEERNYSSENPFEELKRLVTSFKSPVLPGVPRFFGGAVGYVSYESVRFFEKIPAGQDTLGFYDLYFLFPELVLAYDRFDHSLKIIFNARISSNPEEVYETAVKEISEVIRKLNSECIKPESLNFKGDTEVTPVPEMSKEEFMDIVKKAKEYIAQGDVIQVVLSQRFQVKSDLPGFLVYRALRKVNPSPYLFFLELEDECLIGSSPEILVRMEGDRVETRPIAGTRKRGGTEEEDLALEKELCSDEKELAEHMMLVDLGRNDIGRVCKYGSVEVYELMVVERYSHVMHLVSGVRGEAKENVDMFDVFAATFPAGTVSGAPKIRAMEIICELEKRVRGPYAGAVGYFGFSGNMDFCITIRTVFKKADTFYIQAGAGIVADSVPEKEYEETLNKAKAIFKALNLVKEFC